MHSAEACCMVCTIGELWNLACTCSMISRGGATCSPPHTIGNAVGDVGAGVLVVGSGAADVGMETRGLALGTAAALTCGEIVGCCVHTCRSRSTSRKVCSSLARCIFSAFALASTYRPQPRRRFSKGNKTQPSRSFLSSVAAPPMTFTS